jgi:hypothetical protein
MVYVFMVYGSYWAASNGRLVGEYELVERWNILSVYSENLKNALMYNFLFDAREVIQTV